jgi:hypothetical protein
VTSAHTYPLLISSRLRVDEFIFVEYQKGTRVIIDIGPFPHNPGDEEIEKAYAYLQKTNLPYLELHETNWSLVTEKFAAVVPDIRSENLPEFLKHEPAFEVAELPNAPQPLLNGYSAPVPALLRIQFDFPAAAADSDAFSPGETHEPGSQTPPDYPKFIS